MFLKSLLSVNYIFWLLFSMVFYAFGEFFSKKFAINPRVSYVVIVLIAYSLGVLFWLQAMLNKNQLSIVGTTWAVMSMLTTLLIGLIIFHEKLSLIGILGVIFAFVSIILLSLA